MDADLAAPGRADQLLDAANLAAEVVAADGDRIEREGRLTDRVVAAIEDAQLFRLFLPRSVGGPEADPVSALLAVEAISRADGSAGWCAQVSSANSWQLATLAPDTVLDMLGAGADSRRFSGSARPLGRAVPVPGGYLVSGRWDFASNSAHAGWYCGACISEEDGRRRVRAAFFPTSDARIIDTWDVTGLRGTASNDVEVSDLFVPAERVSAGRHLRAQPGALYNQRLLMVSNWALTAGVALGISAGAIDAFVFLAGEGTANTVDVALRDRPSVQGAVGRASALVGAARAYCLDAIGSAWESARAGDTGNGLDRPVREARLAITHAMHSAVQVVDLLFHAAGTRSIFARHQLERRFRDAHVAVQHGAGLPSHFEAGGRLALGLPAGAPFW